MILLGSMCLGFALEVGAEAEGSSGALLLLLLQVVLLFRARFRKS
jgi:hypothetical protein